MTKEIPLTRGMVALVDDEDFERVSKRKWFATEGRCGYFYAQNWEVGLMHRIISETKIGEQIDHIDGNGLNNTKGNLRICSPQENNRNRRVQKNNKSGYKGVHFDRNKYRSLVYVSKKKIDIGRFPTAELAARAYDAKARELFGEFARCNFED